MLALYRCGRQADALEVYSSARAVLAAELGLDPDPHLQRLQQQILTRDPGLELPRAPVPAPASHREPAWLAVPRQLPAAPRSFVGRGSELKVLDRLLDEQAQRGGPAVAVIGGMAGIGKTALAVHWAHQVARQFPDGQLYVNLRGFDPSGTPLEPAAGRCAGS